MRARKIIRLHCRSHLFSTALRFAFFRKAEILPQTHHRTPELQNSTIIRGCVNCAFFAPSLAFIACAFATWSGALRLLPAPHSINFSGSRVRRSISQESWIPTHGTILIRCPARPDTEACHNNFPCSAIFSQITSHRMGGENAVLWEPICNIIYAERNYCVCALCWG